MYVRSITEHFFRFYLLRKDPHNLFLFPLLNISFLYYFSFAETRLHSRGGSSIFFRGAVGRRPVSLAQELHEGGDGSIRERDTLPDEFRAHRVSGGMKFACTWSRREIDNKYIRVCVCMQESERGNAGRRTDETRENEVEEHRLDRLRDGAQKVSEHRWVCSKSSFPLCFPGFRHSVAIIF